jgi:hypothetical protein
MTGPLAGRDHQPQNEQRWGDRRGSDYRGERFEQVHLEGRYACFDGFLL